MSESLELADLEERVFLLRRGGMTPNQIAVHLDMPITEVITHYNSYRKKVASHTMKRDEARELMVARYEGLVEQWYDMAMTGDQDAFDNVLKVLKDEVKVLQLDQLDPADRQVTQNILIVGEDRAQFIAALRAGRGEVADDEIMDGEEVADE